MSILDERFWIALCFLIFVYFVYKPIKLAFLSFVNQKINFIKSQIAEAESIKHEAELLLNKAEEQIANLSKLKQQMLDDATNSATLFLNEKQKAIELATESQQKESLNIIQNQYNASYEKMKNDLMEETFQLVLEYLKTSNNTSLSDIEIAKNLNQKQV